MALFLRTPKLESRNCPEIISVGVSGLWEFITLNCRVQSQQGLNQSCSSPRELSNAVLHSIIGHREEVDSQLLMVLLLPITWAADVQMTNARPFWTFTLQDLSNDTNNTSMRGVLGLVVEL
jgi:hypothetical protein